MSGALRVGQRLEIEVGAVAHGGHCVARHEGQVLFVRHALPGERVVAEVTGIGRKGRFVRAEAVDVLVAAPERRTAPCPVARSCGGCDWQHVTPPGARALKAAVVREAMQRFAGITLPEGFRVEEVPGPDGGPGQDDEGLGWRTRGTLAVDGAGAAGFLAPRSHEVVVAGGCPQLHPALAPLGLFAHPWPPGRVRFVLPAVGGPVAFPDGHAPREPLVQRADGRDWLVAADGFWQVHPGAADALVGHVRRMLAPRSGEALVDLYGGVGLFGLSVADASMTLTIVEGDRNACALAERNAGQRPVTVHRASVERWVSRPGALRGADLVVLDPPRAGAGAAVVAAVCAAGPRAVAYVACDPVALARDVAGFVDAGFRLGELVGLDLFPTTHHVECVALLVPQ